MWFPYQWLLEVSKKHFASAIHVHSIGRQTARKQGKQS